MTGLNLDHLNTILTTACKEFDNLVIKTVSENLSLGLTLEENLSLTAFEIVKKEETHFFPPIKGRINSNNAFFNKIETLAYNDKFSALREENLITNPVKIQVGSHSWSANLLVMGKKVSRVTKIAYLRNDIWQVDRNFMDFLRKVSNYGSSAIGGIKLCSGITIDEYKTFDTEDIKCSVNYKRIYPGGAYVYEGPNCLKLIEINQNTKLPAYPFHRCGNCVGFIYRRLKRSQALTPSEVEKQCITNKKKSTSKGPINIKEPSANMVMESPIRNKVSTLKALVMKPSSIGSKKSLKCSTPSTRRKRLLKVANERSLQKKEILRLRERLTKDKEDVFEEQAKRLEETVYKIETDFSGELEESPQENNPKSKLESRSNSETDEVSRRNKDTKTFLEDQEEYETVFSENIPRDHTPFLNKTLDISDGRDNESESLATQPELYEPEINEDIKPTICYCCGNAALNQQPGNVNVIESQFACEQCSINPNQVCVPSLKKPNKSDDSILITHYLDSQSLTRETLSIDQSLVESEMIGTPNEVIDNVKSKTDLRTTASEYQRIIGENNLNTLKDDTLRVNKANAINLETNEVIVQVDVVKPEEMQLQGLVKSNLENTEKQKEDKIYLREACAKRSKRYRANLSEEKKERFRKAKAEHAKKVRANLTEEKKEYLRKVRAEQRKKYKSKLMEKKVILERNSGIQLYSVQAGIHVRAENICIVFPNPVTNQI